MTKSVKNIAVFGIDANGKTVDYKFAKELKDAKTWSVEFFKGICHRHLQKHCSVQHIRTEQTAMLENIVSLKVMIATPVFGTIGGRRRVIRQEYSEI